jgi:hypothetical protein
MVADGVKQYDSQVGRKLYEWNSSSFPGARRPHYVSKPLDKLVGLEELGNFFKQISEIMPVGDDDCVEIRKRSGIMPEDLPEVEDETVEAPEDEGLQAAGIPTARSILLDVRQQEMTVEAAVPLLVAIGMSPEAARAAAQSQADAEPIPSNTPIPNQATDEDEESDDREENEPGGSDGELSQLIRDGRDTTWRERVSGYLVDLKAAVMGGDDE